MYLHELQLLDSEHCSLNNNQHIHQLDPLLTKTKKFRAFDDSKNCVRLHKLPGKELELEPISYPIGGQGSTRM